MQVQKEPRPLWLEQSNNVKRNCAKSARVRRRGANGKSICNCGSSTKEIPAFACLPTAPCALLTGDGGIVPACTQLDLLLESWGAGAGKLPERQESDGRPACLYSSEFFWRVEADRRSFRAPAGIQPGFIAQGSRRTGEVFPAGAQSARAAQSAEELGGMESGCRLFSFFHQRRSHQHGAGGRTKVSASTGREGSDACRGEALCPCSQVRFARNCQAGGTSWSVIVAAHLEEVFVSSPQSVAPGHFAWADLGSADLD